MESRRRKRAHCDKGAAETGDWATLIRVATYSVSKASGSAPIRFASLWRASHRRHVNAPGW